MPKWGLSETQRMTKPWGLDPDWLKPAKTITDPIHQDIFLNRLEEEIVNSRPMQRLRGVRQLGTSHLVYPGATHSRFTHALGTLRAAQDLLDAAVASLSGPHASGDHLFHQWVNEGSSAPADPDSPSWFDTRLAEATVLARLGALLHDLGHIPMGHTLEDDLGLLKSHDENVARFEFLWAQLEEDVPYELPPKLTDALRPLILSKEKDAAGDLIHDSDKADYPFVADIVGNTICADLMDYLRRDHAATGLPIALGNRFLNDAYVTRHDDSHHKRRMAIGISRHGHVRPDAVTELIKYLRYRYELSERVLYHHAKVAVDAMIGKLVDMWRDVLWLERARDQHPAVITDHVDNLEEAHELLEGAHGAEAVAAVRAHVEDVVEKEFLVWSDDGLLAYIARTCQEKALAGAPGASRLAAVATLSRMVLHRNLFKTAGQAHSSADLANAKETHKRWKDPKARRDLEEAAARFANISSGWKVVVWVPSPRMRPKPADVLVNLNGRVARLGDMGEVTQDASTIVEQHRRLWSVGAYVHPDIADPMQRLAVLAWLRQEMGLDFVDEHGVQAPSVADLLVRVLSDETGVPAKDREELRESAESDAMGGADTFIGRLQQLDVLRVGKGLGRETPLAHERLMELATWPTA